MNKQLPQGVFIMDRLIGTCHPNIFYLKKVKVTKNANSSLVKLAHAQLWLIVVLECQPIRAQRMGFHVSLGWSLYCGRSRV